MENSSKDRRRWAATALALVLLGTVVAVEFLWRRASQAPELIPAGSILISRPAVSVRTFSRTGSGPHAVPTASRLEIAEGRIGHDRPRADARLTAQAQPDSRTPVPQLLPPSAADAAHAAPYVDRLIDPAIAEDVPLEALRAREPGLLPGNASVEYRLFNQDLSGELSGSYTEQGVLFEARQETRAYGVLGVRAAFTDTTANSVSSDSFDGGGYVNVYQRGFAVTDTWLMTNEGGHVRAHAPDLVARGYRVRLPAPLIKGVSSELSSPDAAVRVSAGTLGTYRGRTFPVFTTDASNGNVAGIGGTYRLDPRWETAAQLWKANDTVTGRGIDSFTSVAGALRFADPALGTAQATLLHNDGGTLGLWVDSEKRYAGWQHNAGLYRLDPDLEWVDRNSAILTDTEGAYWRGATRSFRSSLSVGADWSQTNVDNNPALPTRTSSAAFGNLGYRVGPTLDVSGYLSLGQEEVSGTGADLRDDIVTARGSVSSRSAIGVSIGALGITDRTGDNPFTRVDATWDHHWNATPAFRALRTGLAYAEQANSNNDYTEATVRAGGGWSRNRLNLGGNLTFGYFDSELVDDGRVTTVSLGAGWQFAPGWQLGAEFSYNHNALTVVGDTETRVTDRQFLLSLRYDANWGRPEYPLGFTNGKYGRGAVRGIVFLDRNNNGRKDPEEASVPNVTIYLDRGFSTETNASGEFSFNPVASGEHRVSIDIANAPLPWGLEADRPFTVTVRPRETSVLEIPLVRLGGN